MNRTYDAGSLGTLFSTLAALLAPLHGPSGPHAYRAHASKHGLMDGTVETLRLWRRRVNQRRDLGRLDDHLLQDVGLTREQVEAEAAKPFWRA